MDTNKTPISLSKLRIFSGSSLKIIAIITMLIDHIGAVVIFHGYVSPNAPIFAGSAYEDVHNVYLALRFIGRIAFPIFCFLLVQGFIHTSNKRNYAIRLFLFALISEIPFDIAIYDTLLSFSSQNVFFTLLIGFLVIWLIDKWQDKIYLHAIFIGLGMALAYFLATDYSYWGVALISAFYYFRTWPVLQTIGGSLLLLWEAPAIIAFVPINMYNGKRGLSMKYFFYIFYPAHLILLALIRYLLFEM